MLWCSKRLIPWKTRLLLRTNLWIFYSFQDNFKHFNKWPVFTYCWILNTVQKCLLLCNLQVTWDRFSRSQKKKTHKRKEKKGKIYLPYVVLPNLIRQPNALTVISFKRVSFLSLKGPGYSMIICNGTSWHNKKEQKTNPFCFSYFTCFNKLTINMWYTDQN